MKSVFRNTVLSAGIACLTAVMLAAPRMADARYHWSRPAPQYFEGYIQFCAPPQPPVSVEPGPDGTTIFTFINVGNEWVTGNPLIDGVEENKVIATLDEMGFGTARIRGSVDVTALDGSWRFRQRLQFAATGVDGIGFGYGTGDLYGKIMIFRTATAAPPPDDAPCGPNVPAVPLSGKVISFHWIS